MSNGKKTRTFKTKNMEKIKDAVIPMSEERRQEMLRYRQMSNDELVPICKNWTKRDWIDYHTCTGTMTVEEFYQRFLNCCLDDKAEGLAQHSRGCKPADAECQQSRTPKG
jgi:hypothetical protein